MYIPDETEEKIPKYLLFMIHYGKELKELVKAAISQGITREEYIMVLEEMWDECPLIKGK